MIDIQPPAFRQALQEATALRHHLHQHPEQSGREYETHEHLVRYFKRFKPAKLHTQLGASQTGLVVEYSGPEPGPTLMLRADTDALPIQEAGKAAYRSQNSGSMHACGHDGHTAMLAGLAPLLYEQPLQKGRLLLLFQPAEETGSGAAGLLEDARFRALQPDMIFGLHNLPEAKLGELACKDGSFCYASSGLQVRLSGHSSHAAEPELAHSPAPALASLIQAFSKHEPDSAGKTTLTHVALGEPSFGISPGEALLNLTLRAPSDEALAKRKQAACDLIRKAADEHQLRLEIQELEPFPATHNDPLLHQKFQSLARETGFETRELKEAFRWSEDFGLYRQLAPSYFFGLGAGTEQLPLHHPAYDFPDSLLPYGLGIWYMLIRHFLFAPKHD